MQIQVSFIVVTYQRGELLTRCLASIYAQEGLPAPVEVIVVDNGGDAVVPAPPDDRFLLRVERPGRNLGAIGGRNYAMSIAEGQHWIFIDDDALWHASDDAQRIMQHMHTRPDVAAVAVRSLAPDGTPIRTEYPHPDKAWISTRMEAVEVPYFYTMGLGIRAAVVQRVGMYPERFGIYMEELDLSYRVIDSGYVILYDPAVAVFHHRSSLGRPVSGVGYWQNNTLNKARVGWRLLPLPYPITIVLLWSFILLLKTRQPTAVMAVWRALWAERHLLRQERRVIQPRTLHYLRRIGARLLY